MKNRFYGGKLVQCEFSPVQDFREARCRTFHEGVCNRGANCNFMHVKHIPRAVKRRCMEEMHKEHPEYNLDEHMVWKNKKLSKYQSTSTMIRGSKSTARS